MSVGWGSLPLLPLRCVLDHLSVEDALAALSTCRHWRNSILLYEGRKETLKLRVRHLEKNLFLTRLFRKHSKKLRIYIDNCGEELENFINFVLPQFFDTQNLEELVFVGPSYMQAQPAQIAKINRIITESLIFKNSHCLQKFMLMGCEMPTVKNENDRYKHKNVEYYSRPLTFSTASSPADSVISSCNATLMMFSALQHITFDYELMSTATLETLSQFSQISQLSLDIGLRRPMTYPSIDWRVASTNLQVAVHITSVSHKVLDDVIDKVFVQGMPLVSLKVFFCRTLHSGVLQAVVRHYKLTLRELVWADAPYNSTDIFQRIIEQRDNDDEFSMCNVNPMILLCWKCNHLERLIIHGYWVWQYDLIGFVRLRKSLRSLIVSAVYNRQSRFSTAVCSENVVRVLARDTQRPVDEEFIRQVNMYTEFEWAPVAWDELHRALRPEASSADRGDYVLGEILRPFGNYAS